MTMKIDGCTIAITRDDRGRIVAEVWHDETGQTIGITEVDSFADGKHWGIKTIKNFNLKSN